MMTVQETSIISSVFTDRYLFRTILKECNRVESPVRIENSTDITSQSYTAHFQRRKYSDWVSVDSIAEAGFWNLLKYKIARNDNLTIEGNDVVKIITKCPDETLYQWIYTTRPEWFNGTLTSINPQQCITYLQIHGDPKTTQSHHQLVLDRLLQLFNKLPTINKLKQPKKPKKPKTDKKEGKEKTDDDQDTEEEEVEEESSSEEDENEEEKKDEVEKGDTLNGFSKFIKSLTILKSSTLRIHVVESGSVPLMKYIQECEPLASVPKDYFIAAIQLQTPDMLKYLMQTFESSYNEFFASSIKLVNNAKAKLRMTDTKLLRQVLNIKDFFVPPKPSGFKAKAKSKFMEAPLSSEPDTRDIVTDIAKEIPKPNGDRSPTKSVGGFTFGGPVVEKDKEKEEEEELEEELEEEEDLWDVKSYKAPLNNSSTTWLLDPWIAFGIVNKAVQQNKKMGHDEIYQLIMSVCNDLLLNNKEIMTILDSIKSKITNFKLGKKEQVALLHFEGLMVYFTQFTIHEILKYMIETGGTEIIDYLGQTTPASLFMLVCQYGDPEQITASFKYTDKYLDQRSYKLSCFSYMNRKGVDMDFGHSLLQRRSEHMQSKNSVMVSPSTVKFVEFITSFPIYTCTFYMSKTAPYGRSELISILTHLSNYSITVNVNNTMLYAVMNDDINLCKMLVESFHYKIPPPTLSKQSVDVFELAFRYQSCKVIAYFIETNLVSVSQSSSMKLDYNVIGASGNVMLFTLLTSIPYYSFEEWNKKYQKDNKIALSRWLSDIIDGAKELNRTELLSFITNNFEGIEKKINLQTITGL